MTETFGRLTRRAEYLRVAGTRKRCAKPGLVLQAAPSGAASDLEGFRVRVGFTASRKVGGAVERNRARRRLKAAAAAVMPVHAAKGADYVLIGRQASVHRRFADLVSDLEAALRQLGLWRDAAANP
ncbi:MAG TPA: ribonuclease P protein component [Candidatus Cybelea sp.]|nr:ribonuclease P protein component [Candidatus Cybelea sp.]